MPRRRRVVPWPRAPRTRGEQRAEAFMGFPIDYRIVKERLRCSPQLFGYRGHKQAHSKM